jgi:tetratricopeptide (TPR) repeat protein
MSFDFKPDSQQQIPDMPPPQERVGRFSITIGAAFVLLLVVWFAWNPVATAVKAAYGRRCAREARAALGAKEWSRAVEQTIAARRWAPEDVEVIRVVIEFLKVSGSDPGALVQQLRKLAEKQPLTEEEQMLLGRTLAATGKTDEARVVYDKLPLSTSTNKPALELLSNILRQEGHVEEAKVLAARATRKEPETPEARMKIALEDKKSGFVEIRRRAHDELLALAQLETEIAMEAVTHLIIDPLLTATEAHQLLTLVDSHAHKKLPVRLGVVSALMRLQPGQRDTLLDEEIKRFKSGDDGALEHLARWLALEKQHSRLLKLVPLTLAEKSRELYPIMAQALAEEGRWQELKEMLGTGRPPVSSARVAIWQAEASSHLEPDLKEAAHLLMGSIQASEKEGNLPNLFAVASVAEKIHLPEIALAACQAAGSKGGAAALPMLQKTHTLALEQKNSVVLLQTARQLHELRPASSAYADRLAYLRLILGEEIETVDLSLLKESNDMQAMFTVTLERVPPSLLRALAAYRMGDRAGIQQHLAGVGDTSKLPPGQRAVVAGLLSLTGKAERAYQIAEKIPAVVLLDEERAFLQKAL